MPDILDALLDQIEGNKDATADSVYVKTADGQIKFAAADLDELFGELEQVGTIKDADVETPLYEQKVTEADKKAQADRSSKYGIGVKSGGAVTKPKKWKDVEDDDFGDPVNYRYPIHDETHVRNALSRWGDEENRKGYSSEEQSTIKSRIDAAAKKFGIGDDEEKK